MRSFSITVALLISTTLVSAGQAPKAAHSKSELLYAPRPHYPDAAKPYLYSGAGSFLLHFRQDGTISAVTIERSTGHKVLDDAARATFSQWRCRPGAYTVVRIPMSFTTEGAR